MCTEAAQEFGRSKANLKNEAFYLNFIFQTFFLFKTIYYIVIINFI